MMPHMLSYGKTHPATAPCLQNRSLLSVNTLRSYQLRSRVITSLQDVSPDCEESKQLVALKSISNNGFTDAVCIIGLQRESQDRR